MILIEMLVEMKWKYLDVYEQVVNLLIDEEVDALEAREESYAR